MLIATALSASLLFSLQSAPPAIEQESPPVADAPVELAKSETAAETQAQAVSEDEDKVICRRTAITGSRFKKRMCGTAKEWEMLRSRSQNAAKDMQRDGRGLDPNAG